MKKVKLAVMGILVGMSLGMTAFAQDAVLFRAAVDKCSSCGVGDITSYENRKYEHDEKFPCSHYQNGYDVYRVYEIPEGERCDSCSHRYEHTYHVHEYSACEGY